MIRRNRFDNRASQSKWRSTNQSINSWVVRSGDIILLDASNTVDLEGGPMKFMWDLNYLEDSDGDGDTRNDVDSTEDIVYLNRKQWHNHGRTNCR